MGDLIIKYAGDRDVHLLAVLNKELIEDEGHDNKMSLADLEKRMKKFINTEYKAYLFCIAGDIKGYALVKFGRDPFYIRHFYICRGSRRMGLGTEAFHKLLDILGTRCVDIEVMSGNDAAKSFWKSLGFKDRSILMRKTE